MIKDTRNYKRTLDSKIDHSEEKSNVLNEIIQNITSKRPQLKDFYRNKTGVRIHYKNNQ